MDVVRFYQDHGIPFVTEGTKHCRPGWVQTPCPFCVGNPGYHLGHNIASDWFCCWRCKWHSHEEVVKALLSVTWHQAREIVKQYGGRSRLPKSKTPAKDRPREVRLPEGTGPLLGPHRRYLQSRNYNPLYLVKTWALRATNHLGAYKFRIIAPILLDGILVSFQGRDITGRSPLKYKACPESLEVVPHKSILYGLDQASGPSALVLEGVTDVWRFGPGSVATFGIAWKPAQAILLASRFDQIFIGYDPGEDQAAIQAEKLGMTLHTIGVKNVEIIDWQTSVDPGDMSPDQVLEIRKTLGIQEENNG